MMLLPVMVFGHSCSVQLHAASLITCDTALSIPACFRGASVSADPLSTPDALRLVEGARQWPSKREASHPLHMDTACGAVAKAILLYITWLVFSPYCSLTLGCKSWKEAWQQSATFRKPIGVTYPCVISGRLCDAPQTITNEETLGNSGLEWGVGERV